MALENDNFKMKIHNEKIITKHNRMYISVVGFSDEGMSNKTKKEVIERDHKNFSENGISNGIYA